MLDMELYVLAAPSPEEIARLELATDKVNCVCLWIVQGIICEIRSGRLDAPPPIVTRVFQELSRGSQGCVRLQVARRMLTLTVVARRR